MPLMPLYGNPVPADVRRHALALAADGRFLDAISSVETGEQVLDEALERLMVEWRLSAFDSILLDSRPRPVWPPEVADPFPQCPGIPEITAAQLDGTVLAGAIQHHGALLVRGLVSGQEADSLREGVDGAIDGFAAWQADKAIADSPSFTPLALPADSPLQYVRDWILGGGGAWAADSPRMLLRLARLLHRTGLAGMVADYFGERPCLSVGKTTLRRVPASIGRTDWHQDGAFLGQEVRSVNLWLALSPCGSEASGLDLMPRRIPRVLETGTQGAYFDWSVGPGLVEELARETPVVSPEFAAGDALLFDHFLLHRTSAPASMNKDRWAIEAWMFAPSSYPMDQLPLAL